MYGMGSRVHRGTQIKDGLLRYVSLLFLSAGFVVFGFRYEDWCGWVVTLPVYTLMLFLLFGSKIYESLIR